MFGKFPDNNTLGEIAADLLVVKTDLAITQANYEAAVRDIISNRVDVKYENLMSDRRIRLTQQKAEIIDGKKEGPLGKALFPDGSNAITRLQGDSQVDAMTDLEGRLTANAPQWSDAESERVDVHNHREKYALALKGRRTAGQKTRDLRALRNAAKERFVTKYTQAQSRVEAEFPRDKVMQDLFFDEVRTKSASEEADGDEEDVTETT
jgi:hypothetical protein